MALELMNLNNKLTELLENKIAHEVPIRVPWSLFLHGQHTDVDTSLGIRGVIDCISIEDTDIVVSEIKTHARIRHNGIPIVRDDRREFAEFQVITYTLMLKTFFDRIIMGYGDEIEKVYSGRGYLSYGVLKAIYPFKGCKELFDRVERMTLQIATIKTQYYRNISMKIIHLGQTTVLNALREGSNRVIALNETISAERFENFKGKLSQLDPWMVS